MIVEGPKTLNDTKEMGHVLYIWISRIKCPHPYTQFKNLYRCWQWANCRGIWSSWQCGGVTHTVKIETSLDEYICLNIERCAPHVAPSFYYLTFWDKRPIIQRQEWIQNRVGTPTWRRRAPLKRVTLPNEERTKNRSPRTTPQTHRQGQPTTKDAPKPPLTK